MGSESLYYNNILISVKRRTEELNQSLQFPMFQNYISNPELLMFSTLKAENVSCRVPNILSHITVCV
jgi:hypothetical protein